MPFRFFRIIIKIFIPTIGFEPTKLFCKLYEFNEVNKDSLNMINDWRSNLEKVINQIDQSSRIW